MPKAKRYVIYLLTNPNNGYFYIGKDCNYPKRVIQHQNALAHWTDIKLTETILEECNKNNLLEKEKYWIKNFKNNALCKNIVHNCEWKWPIIEMQKDYDSGMTVRDLSSKYHIHHSHITQLIKCDVNRKKQAFYKLNKSRRGKTWIRENGKNVWKECN